MGEEIESHDMQEIQKSWKQIEKNIKTIALGDGLSSGKDNNQQEYFNKGYSEGFSTGLAIGRCLGANFVSGDKSEDDLLANQKRAWCQICEDPNLSLSEVKRRQKEVSGKNIAALQK